jgi:hypothetical protein
LQEETKGDYLQSSMGTIILDKLMSANNELMEIIKDWAFNDIKHPEFKYKELELGKMEKYLCKTYGYALFEINESMKRNVYYEGTVVQLKQKISYATPSTSIEVRVGANAWCFAEPQEDGTVIGSPYGFKCRLKKIESSKKYEIEGFRGLFDKYEIIEILEPEKIKGKILLENVKYSFSKQDEVRLCDIYAIDNGDNTYSFEIFSDSHTVKKDGDYYVEV